MSKLSVTDQVRDESKVNSGFGKNVSNWIGRDMVYPTNVIHMSTECSNRNHSAAFPIELPTWFIKLFTAEGDVVLDPFVGSGTTTQVAKEMGRNFVGIDINPEYAALAASRVLEPQRRLLEEQTEYKIDNQDEAS